MRHLDRASTRLQQGAGARDVASLANYYQSQWETAVENRMPGFAVRDPVKRPARPTRNTLEAGLVAHDDGE